MWLSAALSIMAKRDVVKTMLKQQRKKEKMAEYKKPKFFASADDFAIYTDGGCTKSEEEGEPLLCAGWGYVVIQKGTDESHEGETYTVG